MSLQVLAKACEREVVETVPTAPIFLEGDVGLEARDLWNGMVFKGKAFSLRSICKLFLQNRPILAVVCGVEGKGATLWTSFSSPDAKLCTTAQGDAMEAVKRFFFFFVSPIKVFRLPWLGMFFWNTQALLVMRSLPLKTFFFSSTAFEGSIRSNVAAAKVSA